ncbi:hypothetical protein ISN44_As09g029140 [Arabidopsis suecica]|uniref:Uncharacterized protein n=1 Tax=Arabidopsis suecica TaxID=45249 RepID=A0A8T2ASD1_ARASU|nr:hypothetical protein ISN44_As09g029140 [Arabidopsis suecica]
MRMIREEGFLLSIEDKRIQALYNNNLISFFERLFRLEPFFHWF